MRITRTLRPPGGNGVDETDGAWQAGVGGLLARVGGFEGAPPDDELFDERACRYLFRGETGKPLQSKAVFDVLQAGKNVLAIRPEIDWPIRGMLDHALFAEFRDVGLHREPPGCLPDLKARRPIRLTDCHDVEGWAALVGRFETVKQRISVHVARPLKLPVPARVGCNRYCAA